MLHIATTALDELHSVKRKAIVRMPPALLWPILRICSVTMSVTSPGATRWSSVVDLADEVLDGEEAGDREQREQGGEEGEEEVVGLLRRKVEDVVCQRFAEGALEQLRPAEGNAESFQHTWRG